MSAFNPNNDDLQPKSFDEDKDAQRAEGQNRSPTPYELLVDPNREEHKDASLFLDPPAIPAGFGALAFEATASDDAAINAPITDAETLRNYLDIIFIENGLYDYRFTCTVTMSDGTKLHTKEDNPARPHPHTEETDEQAAAVLMNRGNFSPAVAKALNDKGLTIVFVSYIASDRDGNSFTDIIDPNAPIHTDTDHANISIISGVNPAQDDDSSSDDEEQYLAANMVKVTIADTAQDADSNLSDDGKEDAQAEESSPDPLLTETTEEFIAAEQAADAITTQSSSDLALQPIPARPSRDTYTQATMTSMESSDDEDDALKDYRNADLDDPAKDYVAEDTSLGQPGDYTEEDNPGSNDDDTETEPQEDAVATAQESEFSDISAPFCQNTAKQMRQVGEVEEYTTPDELL